MAHESSVIQIDDTPHSAAPSADGRLVFVTHFRTGALSVLDTVHNTVTKTLQVQCEPGLYGVAAHPDGSAYVAENSADFVMRVDPVTGEIGPDAGINVRPYGLALNPAGSRLFAVCPLDHRIEVLDAGIKNILRIRYNDFGVGLAVSPDGGALYVTNHFAGTVSVLDISAVESAIQAGQSQCDAPTVADISVAAAPYGVAASPDGSRLYVAHFGSQHVISVIDAHSRAVVDMIHASHGMVRGIAAPDNRRIYVTNYFSGSVSVINV